MTMVKNCRMGSLMCMGADVELVVGEQERTLDHEKHQMLYASDWG